MAKISFDLMLALNGRLEACASNPRSQIRIYSLAAFQHIVRLKGCSRGRRTQVYRMLNCQIQSGVPGNVDYH